MVKVIRKHQADIAKSTAFRTGQIGGKKLTWDVPGAAGSDEVLESTLFLRMSCSVVQTLCWWTQTQLQAAFLPTSEVYRDPCDLRRAGPGISNKPSLHLCLAHRNLGAKSAPHAGPVCTKAHFPTPCPAPSGRVTRMMSNRASCSYCNAWPSPGPQGDSTPP